MKRILAIFVIICISLGLFLSLYKPQKQVALIPLDSRPCNTQYPELIGTMANINISIPYEFLDNFLVPGETDKLWEWLDANKKDYDQYIIFTNELFNGGLIASRDPKTYLNIAQNLQQLKEFCLENKSKEIIIISVLPRLLPTQFSQLWSYQEDLINYAKTVDQNSLEGKPLPEPPDTLPRDTLSQYLSIYENSQLIVEEIIKLTEENLVDHFLIGQDDAEEYGLSNRIVREIVKPQLSEKVQFVHGADELTMLALAKHNIPLPQDGLQVRFTNNYFKKYFFPYEAATLEQVLQTKMDYLNLTSNATATDLMLIHNDPDKSGFINEFEPNIDSYTGIMDIAYTNKGDIKIYKALLNNLYREIQGYAGWNTASNTIGTELAHYFAFQYLKNNPRDYSKENREAALRAYIEFKFIRIAEDLVYQGFVRDELIEKLEKENVNPYQFEGTKEKAEKILQGLYVPYKKELENNLIGEYAIGDIKFTVDNITSTISLPWARTFEAKVNVEAALTLE